MTEGGTPIGAVEDDAGALRGGGGIPGGGGGRDVTGVTDKGDAVVDSVSRGSLYGSLAARETISQSPPPEQERPTRPPGRDQV
jgi:hypothetical protein